MPVIMVAERMSDLIIASQADPRPVSESLALPIARD
jgi:hypothetical protein